jgi:hypothetical protein
MKAGVAGAQPMRGEREGCALAIPSSLGVGAEQRDSDGAANAAVVEVLNVNE